MNQEYGKVSVSKAICLPGDLRLKTERELHGSIPGQMLLNKTAETLPATKKRFQTAPASNRSSHYTLPSKSHMGTALFVRSCPVSVMGFSLLAARQPSYQYRIIMMHFPTNNAHVKNTTLFQNVQEFTQKNKKRFGINTQFPPMSSQRLRTHGATGRAKRIGIPARSVALHALREGV